MTYEEFISVISSDIQKTLEENSVNITEYLLSTFPKDQPCVSLNEIQLCRNAVNLSVQLTAQIIFAYLDSLGILKAENLFPRQERPELHLIKGGLYKNPKE